jgi:hypothetical protein
MVECPAGKAFLTCHIGNHHVSLWMMPHKNSEHCNRW